jgi:hypothetical protein
MVDRKEVRRKIVDALESVFTFLYSWVTENREALGRLAYFWHLFAMFTAFIMIFISHTIYPALWFQIFVFIVAVLVWLQHVILHFCICTSLEIRLLGPDATIAVDFLLNFFKIPIMNETRIGITILASSLTAGFLGLSLLSRGMLGLRRHFGLSTFA